MLLATQFNLPDTLSAYNIALFVHIIAAIVAFGCMFAYPVVYAVLRQPVNRLHLPVWHRAQVRVGRMVVTPAAALVLVAGIYLATQGFYKLSTTFVSVGLGIIVVILGIAGSILAPCERKAAELAERDIAAAPHAMIDLSPEYLKVAKKLQLFGGLSALLVVVAVFVMVVKPGA